MELRTSQNGKELTVFLKGELDHHGARKARENTDALIQQKMPAVLKLNFSGVTFMDSSGIGLILGRYRTMKLFGGKLKVVCVPPGLTRIMELSGLCCLDIMEGNGDLNESA